MAMIRERNGRYQLRVKHRLLDKPYTATFDTEAEALAVANQLESTLSKGFIPATLDTSKPAGSGLTIGQAAREYQKAVAASYLDQEVLTLIVVDIGGQKLDNALDYTWSENWVRSLKLERNLAPGTIRKRVGALARMLDWHLKRVAESGAKPLANPLRLLPKNYSTYNEHERRTLENDPKKVVKRDVERDRRLADGEEARIVAVMNGEKRDDRERALLMPERQAMIDLFLLIVNTGLRLREAYRLRASDLQLELRTIHVARSKTGAERDVPILPELFTMLRRRVDDAKNAGGANAPIFPWWAGTDDQDELARITSRLSRAFGRVFAYADCANLTEHDLRHEATCRWVLMRDGEGRWMFRSEEVMRITGHKDPRMFMRYVSLRGSDLADRLWSMPRPALAA